MKYLVTPIAGTASWSVRPDHEQFGYMMPFLGRVEVSSATLTGTWDPPAPVAVTDSKSNAFTRTAPPRWPRVLRWALAVAAMALAVWVLLQSLPRQL